MQLQLCARETIPVYRGAGSGGAGGMDCPNDLRLRSDLSRCSRLACEALHLVSSKYEALAIFIGDFHATP